MIIFIIGGYDEGYDHEEYQFLDSTEIWSNNQSQPHVRLPEGLQGHCLTSLNNTHQLLTGGGSYGYPSAAAYLYSEEDGFTRIEDMKTARWGHGCSVINDSTVVVAGGKDDNYRSLSTTEYLDLNSFKWSNGPKLPRNVSSAKILGPEELGPEIGGHLLIGMDYLFKLAQTRQWTQSKKLNGPRLWAGTFVVDQNMFC